MKEKINNWLGEKMKVPGVLACGIRSHDRKTVTRSNSNQFAPVALENACRFVDDTFQVLNSNHFPIEFVRWVYENYFLYGFFRADGLCLAVLTRRETPHALSQEDIESIATEFQQFET